MPYDVNDPPEKLRGLSDNKQRQWVHVYDSCMKEHGDDIKCNKMAWGVTGGWQDKAKKEFDADELSVMKQYIHNELGLNVEISDLVASEGITSDDVQALEEWLNK